MTTTMVVVIKTLMKLLTNYCLLAVGRRFSPTLLILMVAAWEASLSLADTGLEEGELTMLDKKVSGSV